ncbi:hypothetical protein Q2T40_03410 [Winogradskyella maritima]|nr:hypothetical protein [Winogradskyella maritima]
MASKTIEMPWSAWWFVPVIIVAALLVGALAAYIRHFIYRHLNGKCFKGKS